MKFDTIEDLQNDSKEISIIASLLATFSTQIIGKLLILILSIFTSAVFLATLILYLIGIIGIKYYAAIGICVIVVDLISIVVYNIVNKELAQECYPIVKAVICYKLSPAYSKQKSSSKSKYDLAHMLVNYIDMYDKKCFEENNSRDEYERNVNNE